MIPFDLVEDRVILLRPRSFFKVFGKKSSGVLEDTGIQLFDKMLCEITSGLLESQTSRDERVKGVPKND